MADGIELPSDMLNKIMYFRAMTVYRKAHLRIGRWGVTERGSRIWTYKKSFLNDLCRSYHLKISGTKNELLFRIRDHMRDGLSKKRDRSVRFWKRDNQERRGQLPCL